MRRIIADLLASKSPTDLIGGPGPGPEIPIPPDQINHIRKVLRLEVGSSLAVVDRSTGVEFFGVVSSLEQGQEAIRLLRLSDRGSAGRPRITALIGCPKPAVADSAVEKLTEIGIDAVLFFDASRSQGRNNGEERGKRVDRWARIAEAAIKQSGARRATELAFLPGLAEAVAPADTNGEDTKVRLVCLAPVDLEQEGDSADKLEKKPQPLPILSLFQLNAPLCLQKSVQIDEIYVLVGPEGGLSREEIELLLDRGFTPVTLGQRTLRVETALILVFGILAAWRSGQSLSS